MSQFDVYPNPAGRSKVYPFVVQLQSDLATTGSRDVVVAPLVPVSLLGIHGSVLLPVVTVAGADYRVAVPLLRSAQQRRLAASIGNIRDARWPLLSAVDHLFTGG